MTPTTPEPVRRYRLCDLYEHHAGEAVILATAHDKLVGELRADLRTALVLLSRYMLDTVNADDLAWAQEQCRKLELEALRRAVGEKA